MTRERQIVILVYCRSTERMQRRFNCFKLHYIKFELFRVA